MRGAAATLAAVALAGCGGSSGDATPVVSETAAKLGTIRSGELDFSLLVEPKGGGESFGYRIAGPFSLPAKGGVPEADVEYTQIANGEEATVRLVLDGERGWIVDGDRTTELTAEQLEELVGAATPAEGLGKLDIGDWIVEPELSDGPDGTDEVTAELDVVAAVNDLAALSGALGRELPQLRGKAAERLREAVEESSFQLRTGEDDRLLRRLVVSVDLGFDMPRALRDALGGVDGAGLDFELAIARPNEPVEVEAP